MQKKAFIFTILISGLGSLLFGQKTQANVTLPASSQVNTGNFTGYLSPTGGTPSDGFAASSGFLQQGISLINNTAQVGTSNIESIFHQAEDPTLVFSPTTIPDGLYGSPYSNQTLIVSGGTGPYLFSVTGNILPPGMSLSSDGVLSGTPTVAGTYSFTITALDNSPAPGPFSGSQDYTLVVDPAALTISAANATMPYGGSLPAFSVSYSGFVNGDNASSLSSLPAISSTATSSSPAGNYSITAFGAADPNYTIAYNAGMLTITPVSLTIAANNVSMAYGGTVPSLSATYTGFVNGDNASSLTTPPALTTTATSSSPVGAYTINVTGAADPNYTIAYSPGTLTISPVALTINANNASMTYGGAVPSLSVSYTGFVNGDNTSNLSTQPTITTTATSSSSAGGYPIVASGAADPNYVISYMAGTMTVGKATLTVSADNKTMPLGGPLPSLTISYSGFVNGDNASSLTTQPIATTTATAASPAGAYTITVGGGSSSNYTLSYVDGTLAIGKAVLTITANPAGSVYGAPLVPGSSLTVSYTGFVNGDGPGSLTQPPIVTNTAFTGAPVGGYTLIPSGAQNPNYIIQYVNGTYTISPATLNITVVNQTMTYGSAVPALTASYTGFVNGDNASSLNTSPTIITTATSSSPTGTYPITASGAADPNYTFTYSSGTITVQPATLIVKANSASMTYGGAVPSLSVSYTGFVNGDNVSNLTTAPSIITIANSSSPAGVYLIVASGAVDPNYNISYQSGTMTVGKANLTVSADNKTIPLGGPLPSLTISYAGFVNGDNASNLTTQPIATTTATAASPVGAYAITPGGGSSSNYAFSYVNGTLAVGKTVLTITANPAGSIYGSPLVPGSSLTVSYSGFVNGDGPGSLSQPPVVTNTAIAGAPAGTYTLTPSGAVDPNYVIEYFNGIYTISPAILNITAVNQTMTYGGVLLALTVTYSGFVNGDNASSLTTPPTITTAATSSSSSGTYPITASGAVDPNYNFAYSSGTLTINPAPLGISAVAQTKEYGAADPAFNYTVSGLINGDNASIITGSLNRDPGENVGTYLITKGSLSAGSNYTIGYISNYLTITIASQQITWTQSLVVGCSDTTQIRLTAKASSGLPVTYSVSDPTLATVSGNLLTLLQPGATVVIANQAGDANHAAAPAIMDTVVYLAASLIQQHWSDVIFFDNSSGNYVSWQWYKNGDSVSGANASYFSETPSLDGKYFVIATNKDGQQVQSCTLTIKAGGAIPGGIKVFPNPATAGGMVTITSNYSSIELQSAIMQIIDITGRVRQQITNVQPSMQVTMPYESGTYIINLILSSGQKSSVNVLVE